MRRKPVLAVDMDDTICQLMKRAITYNNIEFPSYPLNYEDIADWNSDHLRHPDSTQKIFLGRPGMFEELDVFDEFVVEEMERLNEAYDLIILTAAQPHTVQEKWNWLQKHMPFISYQNFFSCKRKELVDYDLLIDDGPHNLLSALQKGRKLICIPHPWNLAIREKYNFPTMSSWQNASEKIKQILG